MSCSKNIGNFNKTRWICPSRILNGSSLNIAEEVRGERNMYLHIPIGFNKFRIFLYRTSYLISTQVCICISQIGLLLTVYRKFPRLKSKRLLLPCRSFSRHRPSTFRPPIHYSLSHPTTVSRYSVWRRPFYQSSGSFVLPCSPPLAYS